MTAEGEKPAPEPAAIPEPDPPPVDVVDRLLFVPFLVTFFGVLLIFDIAQRIALLFGRRAHERTVAGLNHGVVLALRLAGTHIEREGTPPFADDTPCIIVSNHQSLFDISILAESFPAGRPRFVAKTELRAWIPAVSLNLRRGGNALIDRRDPRQAIPEIKRLGARMLEQRFAAVIFPEGTRARRGVMKPFHHAGVVTLIHAAPEAPIVPVVLDGSWMLSARPFGPIPRGIRVRVRYLPAIPREGKPAKALVAEAEQIIRNALEKIRHNSGDEPHTEK